MAIDLLHFKFHFFKKIGQLLVPLSLIIPQDIPAFLQLIRSAAGQMLNSTPLSHPSNPRPFTSRLLQL